MHTHIHTYVHKYIHTYIHTYVRTYVRTYIRTYVRTSTNQFSSDENPIDTYNDYIITRTATPTQQLDTTNQT